VVNHCFTPKEDSNQDDDVFETSPDAGKLLWLSIAMTRWSLAQKICAFSRNASCPVGGLGTLFSAAQLCAVAALTNRFIRSRSSSSTDSSSPHAAAPNPRNVLIGG